MHPHAFMHSWLGSCLSMSLYILPFPPILRQTTKTPPTPLTTGAGPRRRGLLLPPRPPRVAGALRCAQGFQLNRSFNLKKKNKPVCFRKTGENAHTHNQQLFPPCQSITPPNTHKQPPPTPPQQEYCDAVDRARRRAGSLQSVPFIVAGVLTPLIGIVIDRCVCKRRVLWGVG